MARVITMAPKPRRQYLLEDTQPIIIIIFLTLGINVPQGGLKKLEKMKRLGMSKIPRGHKRAYFHAEEQR